MPWRHLYLLAKMPCLWCLAGRRSSSARSPIRLRWCSQSHPACCSLAPGSRVWWPGYGDTWFPERHGRAVQICVGWRTRIKITVPAKPSAPYINSETCASPEGRPLSTLAVGQAAVGMCTGQVSTTRENGLGNRKQSQERSYQARSGRSISLRNRVL